MCQMNLPQCMFKSTPKLYKCFFSFIASFFHDEVSKIWAWLVYASHVTSQKTSFDNHVLMVEGPPLAAASCMLCLACCADVICPHALGCVGGVCQQLLSSLQASVKPSYGGTA